MSLVYVGSKGTRGGLTIAAVLFSLGDRDAPPPSCVQACYEMELLSGLSGKRPALCSTDRVASLTEVWPVQDYDGSRQQCYRQLAPATQPSVSQSAQQLGQQTCVCCGLNKEVSALKSNMVNRSQKQKTNLI